MYIVVMQPNNSYVVTEYHTIYLNCIISQVYDYMSIPARLDLQYQRSCRNLPRAILLAVKLVRSIPTRSKQQDLGFLLTFELFSFFALIENIFFSLFLCICMLNFSLWLYMLQITTKNNFLIYFSF